MARAPKSAWASRCAWTARPSLDVSRLDDDDFDAGVARGSINVRVRKQSNDHITLNTAQALFILDGDGPPSPDVDEDREQARLTVFSGHAQWKKLAGGNPSRQAG